MKKQFIKISLGLLVITSAGFISSCESCNHKNSDAIESTDDYEADTDTIYPDTSATGSRNNGTSSEGSYNAGSAPTRSSDNTNHVTREERITNNIENSNASNAYDANGEPVDSGGDMGSGMGTGTGSTGNNSRVTSKKDQLKE